MDQLDGISRDIALAKRVHAIQTRTDLERWKHRSTRRLRFILISLVVGFLCSYLFGLAIGVINSIHEVGALTRETLTRDLFSAFFVGVCFTPLILLPCIVLVTGGVSRYKLLLRSLRAQNRVCDICEAVALFDDKYINPSKDKGQGVAELIPHMNMIEEDGKTSVLCDKCLAEVNANDSDQ